MEKGKKTGVSALRALSALPHGRLLQGRHHSVQHLPLSTTNAVSGSRLWIPTSWFQSCTCETAGTPIRAAADP